MPKRFSNCHCGKREVTEAGLMVEELVNKLSNINYSTNKPASIILAPDTGRNGITKQGSVLRGPYHLDFEGFTN
jgi:hypothetical protein